MTNEEFNELFRKRTMKFAIDVLAFIATLPVNVGTRIISYQLGKSSTSVGANFRAFCRGRSKNERFSKICIVVEESDESMYWLELIEQAKYSEGEILEKLLAESLEILKITATMKESLSR
jgi:four helix bundle protein